MAHVFFVGPVLKASTGSFIRLCGFMLVPRVPQRKARRKAKLWTLRELLHTRVLTHIYVYMKGHANVAS